MNPRLDLQDYRIQHLKALFDRMKRNFDSPFSADILHIPSAISFAQIHSSRPRLFRETF